MMRTAVLCALLFVAGNAQTVGTLNLEQYLGRWYQVYADLPTEVFESRYCVTADYGLAKDGSVSVLNRERKKSVTGSESKIEGSARVVNASEPGKLAVKFPVSPVPGEYWVYLLGPATTPSPTGQGLPLYDYSVVSDSRKVTLFVLARNVTLFQQKYDATILEDLKGLGFSKFYNKPLATYQDGCTYWD